MNKNKIFKIIFWISFLTYIILFLISVHSAIFGHHVYTWIGNQYIRTIYGIEAFTETIIWYGLRLCVIPVLPTVLIIQIIYVVIYTKNKRKIKKNME